MTGGTDRVPGATVSYLGALTIMPKWPLSPPPKVHGNAAILALILRNIL